MTDELRKAAEYCRDKDGYAYLAGTTADRRFIEKAKAVADAYLAEHPADDAEPVTAEWLEYQGWPVYTYPGVWTSRAVSGIGVMVCFGRSVGPVSVKVGGLEWRTDPTRGDLRRLLAALGVTPEPKS